MKINGRKIRESCLRNIEVEFNKIAANKGEVLLAPRRTVKKLAQFINFDL